jgi:hypothetical protein
MTAKFTEKIKTDVKGWKVILFLIAFIIAINGITQILKQLDNQRLAGYISIAILLAMIVFSFKIINRYITEYEFIMTQSRFKANKIVGKRSSKEVFDINLKQMEYIVSQESLKTGNRDLRKKINEKQNLTLIGIKREKMIGYYREGENLNSFIFQPNEKMLVALKKGLGEDKVII